HVRDLEADRLEVGNRTSELVALLRVLHGFVQRALRRAGCARRSVNARGVEAADGAEESHALAAARTVAGVHARVGGLVDREPEVVEPQEPRGDAEVPDFVDLRPGDAVRKRVALFE